MCFLFFLSSQNRLKKNIFFQKNPAFFRDMGFFELRSGRFVKPAERGRRFRSPSASTLSSKNVEISPREMLDVWGWAGHFGRAVFPPRGFDITLCWGFELISTSFDSLRSLSCAGKFLAVYHRPQLSLFRVIVSQQSRVGSGMGRRALVALSFDQNPSTPSEW